MIEYTEVLKYGNRMFTEIVIDAGYMLQIDIQHSEQHPIYKNVALCNGGHRYLDI